MKPLYFIILVLTCCSFYAVAQSGGVKGAVADKQHKPLAMATVSLLQPSDSTLAYFGITDDHGQFLVKQVPEGTYVIQVAMLGYAPLYKKINVGGSVADVGEMEMAEEEVSLQEVKVKADKIPLLIKGDTVEYNAGAYKVKPDAAVEDLLKKLPGVQVDKSGNIKAQGKEVKKVLVDGKEFFGDDPKIATKNLPADAIDKVQVFNKHSDQSQFTGIDDGEREETINLLLKNNKKGGYFGDVQVGGGTGEHYQFSGKVYKFKPKTQLAALGMANNINQFGFSLQDYINFKGGIRSLMDGGGGMSLQLNGQLPVDFGRPVTGLINSGAGGLNYSYEPRAKNRINFSYLGNGSVKDLIERTTTRNYTAEGDFLRNDHPDEHSTDQGHRINFSWKNELDSFNQLVINAGAEYATNNSRRYLLSSSYIKDVVLNNMVSNTDNYGDGVSTEARIAYTRKMKGKWPVLKLSAEGTFSKGLDKTRWDNTTTFYDTSVYTLADRQYQDNRNDKLTYAGGASIVRKLGDGFFLEPEVKAGVNRDHLDRIQGSLSGSGDQVDSLSPDFSRTYTWARPGLSLKHNTQDRQLNIGLRAESGLLATALLHHQEHSSAYFFLLPSAFWQKTIRTGTQLSFSYTSNVNAPAASQMLPVANAANSLNITAGNDRLRPENAHTVHANWVRFDQFSLTSLFANITGRYTHDKINWARTVNADLSQKTVLINVQDDYNLTGRVEYATPLRKLKMNLTVSFEEQYNKGINMVNNVSNVNNTFTHEFSVSGGNKKKEVWDIEAGVGATLTDARYSVDRSLNNSFYTYNAFAQLSYRPGKHWYFSLNADINRYDSRSFDEAVTVPLLKGAVSYYFLTGNRGVLTLDAFDLLDQNKSVQRISQLNYLTENRANVIGQYFMLSFKYRINKTGSASGPGGLEIQTKH